MDPTHIFLVKLQIFIVLGLVCFCCYAQRCWPSFADLIHHYSLFLSSSISMLAELWLFIHSALGTDIRSLPLYYHFHYVLVSSFLSFYYFVLSRHVATSFPSQRLGSQLEIEAHFIDTILSFIRPYTIHISFLPRSSPIKRSSEFFWIPPSFHYYLSTRPLRPFILSWIITYQLVHT